MKAALYARVSLDKQRGNFSIPTQLEAMRKYATDNGLSIAAEYIEDESGATLDRPALDQMRQAAAQKEFDVIICYDLDRLGRNLGHHILLEQELEKCGVTIRYVMGEYKDNPEGRLTKHIKAVIAEYEREKILERTKRGRIGRAKAGQVNIGYRRPYGYSYVGGNHTGRLDVVPDEAEIVRLIFRWYVEEGMSRYKIARKLSEMRVPTVCDQHRNGAAKEKTRAGFGEWCGRTISNILSNEAYAGVWYDNKYKYISKTQRRLRPQEEWIPVRVAPIIDRNLWEIAQVTRVKNRRKSKTSKRQYLLSGLLRCTSCGNGYVGQAMVGDAGRRTYVYYACRGNSLEYRNGRCRESRINATEAEQLIWAKVAEGLRDPQLITHQYATWRGKQPHRLEEATNRLTQVTVALDRLAKQRDRWLELYVDGEVDRKQLKAEQDKIRDRQNGLEQERRALENTIHQPEDIEASIVSFNEFCSSVSNRLDSLSFEEKQKILRLLNIQGTVNKGQIYLSGCVPCWGKQESMFDHKSSELDQLPQLCQPGA